MKATETHEMSLLIYDEELDDAVDHDVVVEFVSSYEAPCRGSRNEFGVQMEPDEAGGFIIEVLSVKAYGEDGKLFDVTKKLPDSSFHKIEDAVNEDLLESLMPEYY